MLKGRILHSCSRINKDQVLVSGGNGDLNSSEIYSISTGKWSWGPSLPKITRHAQMVTVDDITYHIGGYPTKEDVYRLEKNTNPWQWKKIAQLKKKTYKF